MAAALYCALALPRRQMETVGLGKHSSSFAGAEAMATKPRARHDPH